MGQGTSPLVCADGAAPSPLHHGTEENTPFFQLKVEEKNTDRLTGRWTDERKKGGKEGKEGGKKKIPAFASVLMLRHYIIVEIYSMQKLGFFII